MDAEQDTYPGVSEVYARVTALTPAQCRDALAYLIGFTPLGVNLAISEDPGPGTRSANRSRRLTWPPRAIRTTGRHQPAT